MSFPTILTALSRLKIDVNRDWLAYRIENLGTPTLAGHALRRGDESLIDHNSLLNYVLAQHLSLPNTVANVLNDHDLVRHPLSIIPNMDWAHISGLFTRTIAELLSDHDLARHPLSIIPTMDDAHIPNLETLSYGGAFATAQIPSLDAGKVTTGQFPLARMPRAASGQFLEGNGIGADPIFNALGAGDIPSLDAGKITSGVFTEARIPHTFANVITLNAGANVGAGQTVDGVDPSKYTKFVLQWHGGQGAIQFGETRYITPVTFHDTETAGQYPVPQDAVAIALYMHNTFNNLDGPTTVTLRKNGADTAITLTIGAGQVGTFSDTVHSVSFSAGDLASIKMVAGGTTGGNNGGGFTVLFAQGIT